MTVKADQLNHYRRELACQIDSLDPHAALEGDEPVVVVDRRSVEAYAAEHSPGGVSLPLRRISSDSTVPLDTSMTYVCYCDGIGCNASSKAAHQLLTLGFAVRELIGGLVWWNRDGYPTAGESARPGTVVACAC